MSGVRGAPAQDAEQLTQVLAGDRVEVQERRGDWLRVTVPGQASHRDPAGYPGWIRADDLAHDEDAVVAVARGFLGTPYVWGGLTHAGIDCSGLVHVAFRVCGVDVPRDSVDQAVACEPVELGSERPGDLWFFAPAGSAGSAGPGARVTHVGFVTAPGTLLHAPDSGPVRHVVEEPLPEERRATLVASGRFRAP